MKKISCYILFFNLIFNLIFFSCKKKDLPEEPSGTPVFYVNCAVDGSPLGIVAGDDDYFMSTSWGKDSNDFFFFKGDLHQPNPLNERGYSIAVIINDDKASPANAPIDVDGALRVGSHLYNDQHIAGTNQTVSFRPLKDFDTGHSYQWNITDGLSDIRVFNTYSITGTFNVAKTYSVSLTDGEAQGICVPTHTNIFRIGNKLQTTVTAVKNAGSTPDQLKYDLSYTIPGPASYQCQWAFEDNSTATTAAVSKVFPQGSTNIIQLRLVNNDTKDTCFSYYQLNATSGTQCHANYAASFQPVINTRLYSTVTILLTDKDGVVYSSRDTIQPQSSSFELVEVKPYKRNASGDPTRQMRIRFNCIVKNGAKSISLSNGDAVIAVAHKEF